jgi:hypothetical protein
MPPTRAAPLWAKCCHYLPLSDAPLLAVTFNLELPAGRAEVL